MLCVTPAQVRRLEANTRRLMNKPKLRHRAQSSRQSNSHALRRYILHHTPHTTHPTLHTLYYTPYTTHPILHTLHYTPYTTHPTLHTLYYTPYATHPTQNARPRTTPPLRTAHWTSWPCHCGQASVAITVKLFISAHGHLLTTSKLLASRLPDLYSSRCARCPSAPLAQVRLRNRRYRPGAAYTRRKEHSNLGRLH